MSRLVLNKSDRYFRFPQYKYLLWRVKLTLMLQPLYGSNTALHGPLIYRCMLQVRSISLGQDGVTPNQGVFVEEVEITAPKGAPVVFPCRCWLAEDEDDGKTTRVLVPGESLTSRYDSKNAFVFRTSCDGKISCSGSNTATHSERVLFLPPS